MNKILQIIFINFVVAVLFLVLLDIIVGRVYGQFEVKTTDFRYVELREHKPNTVTNRVPEDDYLKYTTNLEKKVYKMSTDNDGFILGPKEVEKNEIDILFLGGSTTECLYVDDSLRFPYLTSQRLSSLTSRGVKTLNGGRSGNNSLHSMIQLISKGIPYEPKLVVLMHNINDFTGLTKTGSYWAAPNSRKIVKRFRNSKDSRLKGFLVSIKNLLIPNIYLALASRQSKSNKPIDEWSLYRDIQQVPIDQRFDDVKTQFRASLRSFIALSRIWNIKPVLMTQPNNHDLVNPNPNIMELYNSYPQEFDYLKFVELYSGLNQVIREIAKEENVLVIDLAKNIPKDTAYIYDGVHMNNSGSVLAAELIASDLLDAFPDLFELK